MQLSACNPRGCSSSCITATMSAVNTAATTATTVAAIAVTTSIKQLRPLQLLRLLQWRLLAQQPYVATPATPSWHTSTVSTLMACTKLLELGAMYVSATCNVYRCCHCTSQPTKQVQTANCKLQTMLLWLRICNSHNTW